MNLSNAFFLSAVITLSFSGAAQAQEVKIATNNLVYNEIFKRVQPGFEKSTGIKIVYANDSYGDGAAISAPEVLRLVVTGKAEAGASAFGVEDWKKAAEKEADLKPYLDKVTFRIIGKDKVAVVAHKEVGVQGLSKEQFAGILSGKIKNWKELGGADVPIAVGHQKNTVARDRLVRKAILNDGEYTKDIKVLESYTTIFEFLSKTPGAITFLPLSYVSEHNLKQLNAPELGRPINMVTVGKPSDALMKLVTYIKDNER